MGRQRRQQGLLGSLTRRTWSPMEYLFCTYYWAVCEEQLGERPFLIYRSMVRSSGYSPNEHIFQMLISAFYKNEDFDGDVQVLRDMLGRLMSPDLSTLSELCDGLCRCGKNQLALALCSMVEEASIA